MANVEEKKMENVEEKRPVQIWVDIQKDFEDWKERTAERKDGTPYNYKEEPAGIAKEPFTVTNKDGKEKEYFSVCVPRGVKVNDEKIGGSHYLVPKNNVLDIDPNHEHARPFEKKEGYAETHKKILINPDYEFSFGYKNYDSETGKSDWVEKTRATAEEYKKAVADTYAKPKDKDAKGKELSKDKAPNHDFGHGRERVDHAAKDKPSVDAPNEKKQIQNPTK